MSVAPRTQEVLNAETLHDIFCHRGMEEIFRTLQNTEGYEAMRLPDGFCAICAQVKAKLRGLSHKVMPVAVSIDTYEDDDDDSDGDGESMLEVE